MSAVLSQHRPPATDHRRRRWLWSALAAAAAVVVGVTAFLVVRDLAWREPSFPSLAAHPDRSLHGTVAYYADRSGCVRIVAAAGRPDKTVLCLPKGQNPAKAAKLGKEVGPQLVWLPGGRLEVTVFRMTPPAKPGAVPAYHPGWQKIVDVRTGHVTDVPAAALPSTPTLATHPMVSPSGRRITWASADGRVKVMVSAGGRSRTLLSVAGPPETYWLGAAFWAPGWHWIAADDGRILIITTGRHPVTRVLTAASSRIVFEQRFARFAVTGADLLPAR